MLIIKRIIEYLERAEEYLILLDDLPNFGAENEEEFEKLPKEEQKLSQLFSNARVSISDLLYTVNQIKDIGDNKEKKQ